MSATDPVSNDALQKGYDGESANIPLLSGKISDLCKFIWAGSLAIFYATLMASASDGAHLFYEKSKTWLLAAAVLGSLCILFDYLQALTGLKHSTDFVDWVEKRIVAKEVITEGDYNARTASCFSRMNDKFFICKNLCAIAAAALIAIAVLRFAAG